MGEFPTPPHDNDAVTNPEGQNQESCLEIVKNNPKLIWDKINLGFGHILESDLQEKVLNALIELGVVEKDRLNLFDLNTEITEAIIDRGDTGYDTTYQKSARIDLDSEYNILPDEKATSTGFTKHIVIELSWKHMGDNEPRFVSANVTTEKRW